MAYQEKYYHEYCDRHGNVFRVSLRVWNPPPDADVVREVYYNDFTSSEIGFHKDGVNFDFVRNGDEVVISDSDGKDGSYTVAGVVHSVPPDDPYIRIQLFPQVPADEHSFDQNVRIRIYAQAREVECGREQFIVERESSSELKLGGVYATRATATFVSNSGFDLQELYTGDETTYLLVRLKNGLLDWQGNVVPDGFTQDNYDTQRSYLTVKATDNLTTLKGKQFVDENGDNFGDSDGEYMQSFLWVIKECLKKTGFLMPIWTLVDIKAQTTGSIPNSIFINQNAQVRSGYETQLKVEYVSGSNREQRIAARDSDFDNISIGAAIKIVSGLGSLNGQTAVVTGKTKYDDTYMVGIYLDLDVSWPITSMFTTSIEVNNPTVSGFTDPLLTVHNIRTWILDSNIEGKTYYEARGGAMMSWDVMDAIARQFGAVVQMNGGHWEVKRWNADKIDDGQYQWFVYNSEGIETGREDFGSDVMMPCKAEENAYRIFGSTLMMDRVLKNAIVNYRYKYNLEGDSLPNLVVNGNFENDFNPDPVGWKKVKVDNISNVPEMQIDKITSGLPPGFSSGIRIRNYLDTRTLDNLTEMSNTGVNKGDSLRISWYEKVDGITGTNLNDAYCGVYSLAVYEVLGHAYATSLPSTGRSTGRDGSRGDKGDIFYAANNGVVKGLGAQPAYPAPLKAKFKARWRDATEGEDSGQSHNRFITPYNLGTAAPEYGRWRYIEVEIEDIPIDGFLKFEVLGVAWDRFVFSFFNPEQSHIPVFAPAAGQTPNRPSSNYDRAIRSFIAPSYGASMVVTGFSITKLIDPDNEAVPQIDPFMYPDYQAQLTRRYSDTIPEIEVLTGDDYGQYAEDRISSMWINGERTTMWDTWDNRFGWSRQGLVLAKSIMEMYWKPTRLLDCEINLPNLHWSSRIRFEEMPGKRFVILRGAIGGPLSTFRGTITEIHDDADEFLPPGGNDGGNTVDPNWQPTGVTRCIRDENGENTGEVESVEIDVNQASPTYGQERWVNIGENTGTCPVGEPIDIYWGASSAFPVDHDTLNYFPYEKTGDAYTVAFDNDGTGKHLVFLHRSSLGTVQSIIYPGTSWNAYGDLPSWEYLSDMTINGYTYKVMRQIYPSGTFTGMGLTFTIQ